MLIDMDQCDDPIDCGHTPTHWLTTNEAARLLGYSDGSVLRHAIKRGDLVEGKHVVKRGNRWFVRREAAVDYHKAMLEDFAQRRPPYRRPLTLAETPES